MANNSQSILSACVLLFKLSLKVPMKFSADWTKSAVETMLDGADREDVPYIPSVMVMDAGGCRPGLACDVRPALQSALHRYATI